uniref:Gustatory receptor n=1 Tax=Tetranychus urticae TaxID=32264 RepID=T1KL57_TETUR
MPRICITDLNGHSTSSRPIGVFAWMMQLEDKKLRLIHLLLISAAIYLIYTDIMEANTSSKLQKIHLIFRYGNLISKILWIVTLRSKRWQYTELVDLFENQTRCILGNERVYRHSTKVRRIFVPLCIMFVVQTIFISVFYRPIMILYGTNDYFHFGKSLTFGLLRAVFICIYPLYTQLIIECCLHIHACWLTVDKQICLLKNIDRRALTIDKIREVRSMYSIAAVITEKMDSFLRFPIAIFFGFYIMANFIFFVQFWTELSLNKLIRFVWRCTVLALVISNMIYIHYLSHKSFDGVYALSYGKHPLQVNNEIHLFLDRIGQSNVGFSFLKISLITPTFVTSLASATLTFVLSLPSLIEESI